MIILLLALPFAAAALAAEPPADSCDGTWQSNDGRGVEITLTRTDETIHVKEERDHKVVLDYTCKLDAKQCEVKEEGRKVKVSLWMNGTRLVEVRAHGDKLTRRRFIPVGDGKNLQVEEAEMSPPGSPETIAYVRRP